MALPDGAEKALILAPLLSCLPEHAKEDGALSLLSSLRAISPGKRVPLFGGIEARHQVIGNIGPLMPPSLILECVKDFGELGDAWERCASLLAISAHVPNELKEPTIWNSLRAAMVIHDPKDRADSLMLIAVQQDFDGRTQAMRAAFEAIEQVEKAEARVSLFANLLLLPLPAWRHDVQVAAFESARRTMFGEERAAAFEKIAGWMDESMWQLMLQDTAADHEEFYKAVILQKFARQIPERTRDFALSIARSIESPFERAVALASVASSLPKGTAHILCEEALDLVSRIDDLSEVSSVCQMLRGGSGDDEMMTAADLAERQVEGPAGCVVALACASTCGPAERPRIVQLAIQKLRQMRDQPYWRLAYIGLIPLADDGDLDEVIALAENAIWETVGRHNRVSGFEDLIQATSSSHGLIAHSTLSAWLRELGSGSRRECLNAIGGTHSEVAYVGSLVKKLGRESDVARHIVGIGAVLAAASGSGAQEACGAIQDVSKWWP
jgi:hypothetical protein